MHYRYITEQTSYVTGPIPGDMSLISTFNTAHLTKNPCTVHP